MENEKSAENSRENLVTTETGKDLMDLKIDLLAWQNTQEMDNIFSKYLST